MDDLFRPHQLPPTGKHSGSESDSGLPGLEPGSLTTNARLGIGSTPDDIESDDRVLDAREMARLVEESLHASEEEAVRERRERETVAIQTLVAAEPEPEPEEEEPERVLAIREPPYSGTGVTERQAAWIAERLRVEDDLVACANTGIPAEDVLVWREDPAFNESIAEYLTDKRGAFRPLSAHLLPLAWQVIHRMLGSGDARVQKEGLKYLLQSQGLLINVQETTSSEALRRLVEDINRQVPVEVIDVKPR